METKAFNTRFTLSSEVEKLSKRQLLRLCWQYDLNLTTNNRKEVYVRAVTKYVLENAETILSHLMIKDVELVRDLVKIGPGKGLAVPYNALFYLPSVLFIQSIPDEKHDVCWYVMSYELRKVIGTKAEELLSDPEYRKRSEMLQFIQGTKTVFGMPYTWDVREDFETCYPEYKGNNEVWRDLMTSPSTLLDIHIYITDQERGFLFYPLIDRVAPKLIDVLVEGENKGLIRKEFSRQEILDAGRQPFPVFTGEAALRLRKHFCEELEMEPEEANNCMWELWLEGQPIYNQKDKAAKLVEEFFIVKKLESVEKVVGLVNDFLNSTPCWALLGHSVDEVSGPIHIRK